MAINISGIHEVHSVEITKLRSMESMECHGVHTCEIIIIHDDLYGKSVTTTVDIYCDKSTIEIIVPNQRANGGQHVI